MSGLLTRLRTWAKAARDTSGPAATEGASLAIYLSDPLVAAAINSAADPTSWEWGWHSGIYPPLVRAVAWRVNRTTELLLDAGELAEAETGAALIDELDAGAELADDQVQIVIDAAASVTRRAGLTLAGALALWFGAQLLLRRR